MPRVHVRLLISLSLLCLAAAILVPMFLRLAVAPYTFTSVSEVPHTQIAIVLGASVIHGAPSPVLAKRADMAIALYRAGKVDKVLVTGDNGDLSYDEVTPVRKYMIDAGIPASDIFLDHAGFDTYSSMYRAIHIFQVDSMTIVTQDFHMPRALYIARHLGAAAYGLVAEGETRASENYLREIPASLKALFDLMFHRFPRYLGETIPLEGSGTSTWY